MSVIAPTYREGDRCGVCGHWWWTDGKWHSLVPAVWADTPEEAREVTCPLHLGPESEDEGDRGEAESPANPQASKPSPSASDSMPEEDEGG